MADGDSQNSGNSGGISLKAEAVSFADGAVVSTSTYSQGHGGDVTVNASETVSITGSGSGIFTITSGFMTDHAGTGGNIAILAKP
ncbi:MAG: hypothetical protein HC887_11000 [Desulfobacteraceae bacterium]|nr:hypothetical protein [Desulfobacteraceae bacterium]